MCTHNDSVNLKESTGFKLGSSIPDVMALIIRAVIPVTLTRLTLPIAISIALCIVLPIALFVALFTVPSSVLDLSPYPRAESSSTRHMCYHGVDW